MNIFKELILAAPIKERLVFGHNMNVIIKSISTDVKKVKGIPINANTFIMLSQINPETKKIVANSETQFWNLDSTSDFLISNFENQLSQMLGMIEAVSGDADADLFSDKVLENVPEGEELDAFLQTKKGAKIIQDAMMNSFAEILTPKLGVENCPLLKCKMIVNKKGYAETAKVASWILPMDGKEELPEVTSYEQQLYDDSLKSNDQKQSKPDAVGDKKAGKITSDKDADNASKPDAVKGEKKVTKKSFRKL